MSRLNDKRRALEKEIATVRQQITEARRLGEQVDELALRLAVLRSDLNMITLPVRPGWIQRINTIGGVR